MNIVIGILLSALMVFGGIDKSPSESDVSGGYDIFTVEPITALSSSACPYISVTLSANDSDGDYVDFVGGLCNIVSIEVSSGWSGAVVNWQVSYTEGGNTVNDSGYCSSPSNCFGWMGDTVDWDSDFTFNAWSGSITGSATVEVIFE